MKRIEINPLNVKIQRVSVPMLLLECLAALRALEGSFVGMRPDVRPAVAVVSKLLSAVRTTRERGLAPSRMHALLMANQVVLRLEVLTAIGTVTRLRLFAALRVQRRHLQSIESGHRGSGGGGRGRAWRERRWLRHRYIAIIVMIAFGL